MRSLIEGPGLGVHAAILLALVSSNALAADTQQSANANNDNGSAGQAAVRTQASEDVDDVDDSTVVYPAAFFEPYSPVSANDMLDRIPGVSVGGGGGGGRGLGTGGDLLINGQRLAGKDNSKIGRAHV